MFFVGLLLGIFVAYALIIVLIYAFLIEKPDSDGKSELDKTVHVAQLPIVPPVRDASQIYDSIKAKHFFEKTGSVLGQPGAPTEWFNLLLNRIFLEYKIFSLEERVRAKMNRKLKKAKNAGEFPSFVGDMVVSSLSMGSFLPNVGAVTMLPPTQAFELRLEFDMAYAGGFAATIDTEIWITLPAKGRVSLPVSLSVTIEQIAGRMLFVCPTGVDPVCTLSFYEEPITKISASPVLGKSKRLRNIPALSGFIVSKIQKFFRKDFVNPNGICLHLPLKEGITEGRNLQVKTVRGYRELVESGAFKPPPMNAVPLGSNAQATSGALANGKNTMKHQELRDDLSYVEKKMKKKAKRESLEAEAKAIAELAAKAATEVKPEVIEAADTGGFMGHFSKLRARIARSFDSRADEDRRSSAMPENTKTADEKTTPATSPAQDEAPAPAAASPRPTNAKPRSSWNSDESGSNLFNTAWEDQDVPDNAKPAGKESSGWAGAGAPARAPAAPSQAKAAVSPQQQAPAGHSRSAVSTATVQHTRKPSVDEEIESLDPLGATFGQRTVSTRASQSSPKSQFFHDSVPAAPSVRSDKTAPGAPVAPAPVKDSDAAAPVSASAAAALAPAISALALDGEPTVAPAGTGKALRMCQSEGSLLALAEAVQHPLISSSSSGSFSSRTSDGYFPGFSPADVSAGFLYTSSSISKSPKADVVPDPIQPPPVSAAVADVPVPEAVVSDDGSLLLVAAEGEGSAGAGLLDQSDVIPVEPEALIDSAPSANSDATDATDATDSTDVVALSTHTDVTDSSAPSSEEFAAVSELAAEHMFADEPVPVPQSEVVEPDVLSVPEASAAAAIDDASVDSAAALVPSAADAPSAPESHESRDAGSWLDDTEEGPLESSPVSRDDVERTVPIGDATPEQASASKSDAEPDLASDAACDVSVSLPALAAEPDSAYVPAQVATAVPTLPDPAAPVESAAGSKAVLLADDAGATSAVLPASNDARAPEASSAGLSWRSSGSDFGPVAAASAVFGPVAGASATPAPTTTLRPFSIVSSETAAKPDPPAPTTSVASAPEPAAEVFPGPGSSVTDVQHDQSPGFAVDVPGLPGFDAAPEPAAVPAPAAAPSAPDQPLNDVVPGLFNRRPGSDSYSAPSTRSRRKKATFLWDDDEPLEPDQPAFDVFSVPPPAVHASKPFEPANSHVDKAATATSAPSAASKPGPALGLFGSDDKPAVSSLKALSDTSAGSPLFGTGRPSRPGASVPEDIFDVPPPSASAANSSFSAVAVSSPLTASADRSPLFSAPMSHRVRGSSSSANSVATDIFGSLDSAVGTVAGSSPSLVPKNTMASKPASAPKGVSHDPLSMSHDQDSPQHSPAVARALQGAAQHDRGSPQHTPAISPSSPVPAVHEVDPLAFLTPMHPKKSDKRKKTMDSSWMME
eukprot:TRINITY_DN6612_c0_g1_i1.p1 TRINITY_DN6612_c0_g1~~TRINITY_DN6612_c0_g1_i1.p1  ORF type:complete len:1425 (-),score=262.82 TRINITY_DN6612_c0_g1_i1:118-4392(-)